jgi:hypothetical protein
VASSLSICGCVRPGTMGTDGRTTSALSPKNHRNQPDPKQKCIYPGKGAVQCRQCQRPGPYVCRSLQIELGGSPLLQQGGAGLQSSGKRFITWERALALDSRTLLRNAEADCSHPPRSFFSSSHADLSPCALPLRSPLAGEHEQSRTRSTPTVEATEAPLFEGYGLQPVREPEIETLALATEEPGSLNRPQMSPAEHA